MDQEAVGDSGDGRSARRERNVNAVLDVVVELFTEGELFPTVEQVSKRSGVSVRSIYRYFDDPTRLHNAAVVRHRERSIPLAHLHGIGTGPLTDRVDAFVEMRLRLHEGIGPTYRATVHNAPGHPRLQEELARNRRALTEQFERQFEPELAALDREERFAVCTAGDALTQLESIELLRSDRRLSALRTRQVLRAGLLRLLEEIR